MVINDFLHFLHIFSATLEEEKLKWRLVTNGSFLVDILWILDVLKSSKFQHF